MYFMVTSGCFGQNIITAGVNFNSDSFFHHCDACFFNPVVPAGSNIFNFLKIYIDFLAATQK